MLAGAALGAGLPGLAGAALLSRRARPAALRRERARHLECLRSAHARWAVVDRRRRTACELTEVAAQELSAMVVQLSAAQRQARREPGLQQLLGQAREQGSATLAQLRQAAGVLRDDDGDEPGDREPPPSPPRPAPAAWSIGALRRGDPFAGG